MQPTTARKTQSNITAALSWLSIVPLAALSLSLIDSAFVVATLPVVTSQSAGLVMLVLKGAGYVSIVLIPIALVMSLLSNFVPNVVPTVPNGLLRATLASALIACVATLLHTAVWQKAIQFPLPVKKIETVVLGVIAFFIIVGSLQLGGFCKRVTNALPKLSGFTLPIWALSVVALLFWLAHKAIGPLHLDLLNRPLALVVSVMLLLLYRAAFDAPRPILLVMLASLVATVPIHNPHAQFFLLGHPSLSGALATQVRDFSDFDHDGTGASWLGGNDCAPTNPHVGPTEREVPGNGIDEDCRGGDAKSVNQKTNRKLLPNSCETLPVNASVLLITIDALRTDVIDEQITPTLSKLANQSLNYRRAYTTSTMTIKAMVSMFAGVPLSTVGTPNLLRRKALNTQMSVVPSFAAAGFKTVMLNYFGFMNANIVLGFSERNPAWVDDFPRGLMADFSSASVSQSAVHWIESMGDRRFFLWTHYADAHAPYLQGNREDPDARRYALEVGYVDMQLGRMLNTLACNKRLSNVVVAITADHGEELGVRGALGHGPNVFEDVIGVPLFVVIPGCPPQRIDQPVSTADLMPSLVKWLGVPVDATERNADEAVVAEALMDDMSYNQAAFKRATIVADYKLIVDVRNGGRTLFNLNNDPHESKNLYGRDAKTTRKLESAYQQWLDNL